MDLNLRIQKDEYGNKVIRFNLSYTERITLPYEMAKTLNKQLTCALEETTDDASALPIPDVSDTVCEHPFKEVSQSGGAFYCHKCKEWF